MAALLLTRFASMPRRGLVIAGGALLFALSYVVFTIDNTVANAVIGNLGLGAGMTTAVVSSTILIQQLVRMKCGPSHEYRAAQHGVCPVDDDANRHARPMVNFAGTLSWPRFGHPWRYISHSSDSPADLACVIQRLRRFRRSEVSASSSQSSAYWARRDISGNCTHHGTDVLYRGSAASA
ncbi:MAG: hypothetical protein CM1200mP9_01970 [Gammaproteobacteria bacterium]|nr:MAG: hypothetical protein CM1200mP9_01970 [Gammaproteobacteria bacterium]